MKKHIFLLALPLYSKRQQCVIGAHLYIVILLFIICSKIQVLDSRIFKIWSKRFLHGFVGGGGGWVNKLNIIQKCILNLFLTHFFIAIHT